MRHLHRKYQTDQVQDPGSRNGRLSSTSVVLTALGSSDTLARLRLPEEIRTTYFRQAVEDACRRDEILSEARAAGFEAAELAAEVYEREAEAWATVQDEEAQLADVLAEQQTRVG